MHVRIIDEALSIDRCVAAVQHPSCGAVVVFVGCVRDHTAHDGKPVRVERLEYEAYAAMAEQEIARIATEAHDRWRGARVAVEHRTGALVVGELAVVIAVAAPHRAEAFDACRFAIERLKKDAPIWKREHGDDGVVWVGMGP